MQTCRTKKARGRERHRESEREGEGEGEREGGITRSEEPTEERGEGIQRLQQLFIQLYQ